MNAVIGQSFTSAKSGVPGVVQEIVETQTGTYRSRLDVTGHDRWTAAQ